MKSADDPTRHRGDDGKFDRPRADAAGFPSEIYGRSRQFSDGMLNSSKPVSTKTNATVQPSTVHVSSSSDFPGNDQRLGVKPSSSASQEYFATVPSSDVASSVRPQTQVEPTRSVPPSDVENADLQVCTVVE